MRGVKLLSAAVALALAVVASLEATATSPVALETHVLLKVQAVTVEHGRSQSAGGPESAEIGPGVPGTIDLAVPWGADGASVAVHLTATLVSSTPNGESVLEVESSAGWTGRPPVVASRRIELADEGSSLFEVFGEGERRLLLTLQGESVPRAVVRPRPVIGAPVRFTVAVLRVDGDRVVELETNELHTFVGQAVEYSFKRGQGDALESVRLSVLPVSISGDVVTIDAEIGGALPGATGTVLVNHHERIVASRQSTSRLLAATGNPPAGYQFQVTPDF
jgi:hypothetical protein